ncbi:MAG: gamma carbonic anhydrase family protein [Ancalomicrobiaceae bacterium]|nr:gamma carbonic anhydrase family protein [Ancalomicrobiaceae bacterium]
MIIRHAGKTPEIDGGAFVAPDATVCGDVRIGWGTRIMHGARLIAEAGGRIEIGNECIVLENAVVRATAAHCCRIGDHTLIGPHAHVVGATIVGRAFIATGAAVFHGAHLAENTEVRINGVVHIDTRLEAGTTVPIGWVAVGDPAKILPPGEHEAIWAVQRPLDFPRRVYGVDRSAPDVMAEITTQMSEWLAAHAADEVIRS